MGLKDSRLKTNWNPIQLKYLLLIGYLFLSNVICAEVKKDTPINQACIDTIRPEKEQFFEIEPNYSLVYSKPKLFQSVRRIPSDLSGIGKTCFSKKNLPKIATILAGSAILIAVDQPVIDAAQQFGRYIHLDATQKFKTVVKTTVGNSEIAVMELPQNLNSAMYFIGERWPTLLSASCFYSYGLLKSDNRALQTSSQLTEVFLTTTIATQFLKRITGRESPFRATQSGGDWHLFPTPSNYQHDKSKFDAFPSGHMALTMAAVTVLAGNYPEHKYIKPVGYSLMGLMGYAMLNNGVHWISDFPLGIAIGFTCGKVALSHNKRANPTRIKYTGKSSSLIPMYLGQGGLGINYRATF